jgi:hypothetical protein
MRHARPPSLRYGAPSSCGQHSRTTWPRRRPCGVGLTAGKAGRFTYSAVSAEGATGLKPGMERSGTPEMGIVCEQALRDLACTSRRHFRFCAPNKRSKGAPERARLSFSPLTFQFSLLTFGVSRGRCASHRNVLQLEARFLVCTRLESR